MTKDDNSIEMITAEETDILQEIMNIAFGRAASDLAEYIDIFVVLNVPYIKLLQASDLPPYINKEIKDYDKVSVVEQNFWGKFKGSAFLIFPSGTFCKIRK
jgi:chemotaxis protein CheC